MDKEDKKQKKDDINSEKIKEMFELVNSMQEEEMEFSPIPIVTDEN